MKHAGRIALLTISLALSLAAIAEAKSAAHKRPVSQTAKSDVVVTKNPDGTVEVTDNDDSAPATKPGITYRPAPPGTVRYGDGVVVHRNADGSVDVSDEDSLHPVMHSLGSTPTAAPHRATTHSAKKHPSAKKK